MDTRGTGSRIGRVVTGRVKIRRRASPMRAVRTTGRFATVVARAAERRAEVEGARRFARSRHSRRNGAANVGALGESPSSPPATILASADRDALADPPGRSVSSGASAPPSAHARTVDARVQREVEAAAAIAAEKAADDAHAALERRLAETRGRSTTRASREPTPKRAPPRRRFHRRRPRSARRENLRRRRRRRRRGAAAR